MMEYKTLNVFELVFSILYKLYLTCSTVCQDEKSVPLTWNREIIWNKTDTGPRVTRPKISDKMSKITKFYSHRFVGNAIKDYSVIWPKWLFVRYQARSVHFQTFWTITYNRWNIFLLNVCHRDLIHLNTYLGT